MKIQEEIGLSNSEISFFERLNYFFGKLLTVRDFLTEQSYFNEKRWLLNRRSIGWGVVCGLTVECHSKCTTQVVVKPGLALDHYGHEIFVGEEQTIDLYGKGEESKETFSLEPTQPPPTGAPGPDTFYICIRYKECLSEPVPVPVQKCSESKEECQYSRIRELFEIKAFENEPPTDCETEFEIRCPETIETTCEEIVNPCEPRKKCYWIILAKVTFEEELKSIDNHSLRKYLWSNEVLTSCLKKTVHRGRGARIDRRQFVPLLSQTIRGLEHQDGRILTITDHWNEEDIKGTPGRKKLDVGKHPFNITTDGDYIWFTDDGTDNENVVRIDRWGTSSQKLALANETPELADIESYGIAFDGCYLWVTHPNKNLVSKIYPKIDQATGAPGVIKARIEVDLPPKEIIFAGDSVWIGHSEGKITKINIYTHEKQYLDHLSFESPVAMTFDGIHIWVVCSGPNNQVCANRIELNGNEAPLIKEISFGDTPQDIVFDGTHVWVTHRNGATNVDIDSHIPKDAANVNYHLCGLAFDGMYLWAAEFQGQRVHRIDPYEIRGVSNYQPGDNISDSRHFAKMCCDGEFIWITDYEMSPPQREPKGVIHRLLV